MWIITQEGFYSVTAYDPHRGGGRADSDELILVRARVRADLERVTECIGDDILATPNADYPFRVIASRKSWIGYVTHEIDYFNFKNRVTERLGSFRHDVLLTVWLALGRLQHQS